MRKLRVAILWSLGRWRDAETCAEWQSVLNRHNPHQSILLDISDACLFAKRPTILEGPHTWGKHPVTHVNVLFCAEQMNVHSSEANATSDDPNASGCKSCRELPSTCLLTRNRQVDKA